MLEIYNSTVLDVSFEILKKISKKLTYKNIELLFVNNEEMQNLNLTHRNIDKTTDVLSFPYEDIPYSPLGSIVINLSLAKEMSTSLNHKFEDEVALLFIHGLLHLLGYDHEIDNGQMRQKEAGLIVEFNLPKSLIERSQ